MRPGSDNKGVPASEIKDKILPWLIYSTIFTIFFFSLKEYSRFDYLLVFFSGLVNDTVVGLPLGLSSLSYILICIFASYLRNITIRPDLIKDWFYFLFIISLINSLNYSILFLFFNYDLDIMFYLVNNFFTFILYIPLTLYRHRIVENR